MSPFDEARRTRRLSDLVLVALITGLLGTANVLIARVGQKEVLAKTNEVHLLVNSRAGTQDSLIAGLVKEVIVLREQLAEIRGSK